MRGPVMPPIKEVNAASAFWGCGGCMAFHLHQKGRNYNCQGVGGAEERAGMRSMKEINALSDL